MISYKPLVGILPDFWLRCSWGQRCTVTLWVQGQDHI